MHTFLLSVVGKVSGKGRECEKGMMGKESV